MMARASVFHVAIASAIGIAWAASPVVSASPGEAPPWLGVGISDGLYGVRVDEVIPDTPADDAGLVVGDEITAVSGALVDGVSALQSAIASHRVADKVVLSVWRHERMLALSATLGPRLEPGEILYRRLVGKPAPRFDASVLRGASSGDLEHLRGRVVVLAFFTTECRDCVDTHPRLSRLADARERDGMAVLAVSAEPRSALEAWVQRMVPSFTVLHDAYGEMLRSFRVDRTPAVVVIGRGGDVVYAGLGAGGSLERAILAAERALRSPTTWAR